jgi:hypothetical protein
LSSALSIWFRVELNIERMLSRSCSQKSLRETVRTTVFDPLVLEAGEPPDGAIAADCPPLPPDPDDAISPVTPMDETVSRVMFT